MLKSSESARFLTAKTRINSVFMRVFSSLLYHTKNKKGTTTVSASCIENYTLYHTKNKKGTTTTTVLPFSV